LEKSHWKRDFFPGKPTMMFVLHVFVPYVV